MHDHPYDDTTGEATGICPVARCWYNHPDLDPETYHDAGQ